MGFSKMEETSSTVADRFEVEAFTRKVIGVSIPYAHVKVRPLEGYPYEMMAMNTSLPLPARASSRSSLRNLNSVSRPTNASCGVRPSGHPYASSLRLCMPEVSKRIIRAKRFGGTVPFARPMAGMGGFRLVLGPNQRAVENPTGPPCRRSIGLWGLSGYSLPRGLKMLPILYQDRLCC